MFRRQGQEVQEQAMCKEDWSQKTEVPKKMPLRMHKDEATSEARGLMFGRQGQ